MYDWSSLNNCFPCFSFYKCCWNLNCLSFKSNYLSHFVLYYPGGFVPGYMSREVLHVQYIQSLHLLFVISFIHLNLMLYLLFIISLGWIHQLLPKNSKVSTSWSYQKCILKPKNFRQWKFGIQDWSKNVNNRKYCCPKLFNVQKF